MPTTAHTPSPPAGGPSPGVADALRSLAVPTPGGTLAVILRGGAVVAAGFTDPSTIARRLDLDTAPPPADPDTPVVGRIRAWLDGDLHALDGVPLDQPGTDFQRQVWDALRAVPPGRTATYGQLAATVGRPSATRAVGSACGRNRIAPFVPCHRAVRGDGGLGGYAWGLDAKRWLLAHESGQGRPDERPT